MRRAPSGSGSSEVQHDFSEQRLIYKCRLDPSTDNSGYAGVVRVVRNGGSARMEGDTLVVEDASSLVLLTRIEWFSDYSEEKVEAVRQAVEGLMPAAPLVAPSRMGCGPCTSSRIGNTPSPFEMGPLSIENGCVGSVTKSEPPVRNLISADYQIETVLSLLRGSMSALP